jgi:hypothetical protein
MTKDTTYILVSIEELDEVIHVRQFPGDFWRVPYFSVILTADFINCRWKHHNNTKRPKIKITPVTNCPATTCDDN